MASKDLARCRGVFISLGSIFKPAKPFTWPVNVMMGIPSKFAVLGNAEHCISSKPEKVFYIFKHYLSCAIIPVKGELACLS